MKIKPVAILALPLLILTACEEEVPEAVSTETGGEAAGEILGGTISDEMIPLEELTSTSPPAERSSAVSGGGRSAPAAAEAAPEPAAPAAEPNEPLTADPSRPIPHTQEAEGSNEPPAS